MPTPEKEALVAQLRADMEAHDSFYLAEFSELSVAAMSQLRAQIRAAQARLQVAKNRLLKLALQGTEAEELTAYLTGPTAITFCSADPIAVAKVFTDFARQHDAVAIKAGFVEGRMLDRQQAARLAALPPRPQILAGLLAQLTSPAAGLTRVLGAAAAELVFTLESIAEKREQSEAGA